MDQFRVFIVEDDSWYADILKYHISQDPSFEVHHFETGTECLRNLHLRPLLVTLDYALPDIAGAQMLRNILENDPEARVIIVSGQKDITTAVRLLKEGAYDYIVKDEEARDRLLGTLQKVKEAFRLKTENERLREEIGKKYVFGESIIGNSAGLKEVYSLIEKAAASQITVAITGETGTGKELVAKAIHYHSQRRRHPFVAINFSTIPRELVESELFGYERGAFTGANSRKTGLFEEAGKGTIFLDEVADIDPQMQSRLLRVLQEREFRRIGGNASVAVEARVITATHKNLAREVEAGNFRADLYFRLMGLQISLSPLRDRGRDVLLLAKHFADDFCKFNKRPKVNFTEEALRKLSGYSYPGNIRELKAVVELAIILSDDGIIRPSSITFNPVNDSTDFYDEETTLDGYIIKIIRHYLAKHDRNLYQTAKNLGISRATLYRYINRYGL